MTTLTLSPRELLPGDVVLAHGMRCLVEHAPELSQSHPVDERGGCYWTQTRVLNRAEVSREAVPYSFTQPRHVWDHEQRRWIVPAHTIEDHRWTIQGNDLARYAVERA